MLVVRKRALTLKPSVHRFGRQLRLSTPWFIRLVTLGGFVHQVHVDGDARYIYLHERTLWFFVTTRVIRIGDIARIVYSFADIPTTFDRTGRVHDTLEEFNVALELKNSGERVHLATFFGEGAAGDFATWLLGDDAIELAGTQESDSRHVVQQLCEVTGLSAGPSVVPLRGSDGRRWQCSGCLRAVPPRPRCLYCGGPAGPCDRG